jgi:hypothetical protein
MTINDSSYDTNISVDLNNFDLSLKTQYNQVDDNLELQILSFIEKFDLIKVTIPDQRLQEIWNLVMNTEMMQDFLIEDIFHHYFIKSLPKINLTDLLTFTLDKKDFALKVLQIPQLVETDKTKFLDVKVGLEMTSSRSNFHIENVNELLNKSTSELKELKSKLREDNGKDDNDDDSVQDIQVIADASLLSLIGSHMLGDLTLNLSEIKAVQSVLTLKNLKIVFPSLTNFYSDDADVVNMNLKLNIQGKFPVSLNVRSRK